MHMHVIHRSHNVISVSSCVLQSLSVPHTFLFIFFSFKIAGCLAYMYNVTYTHEQALTGIIRLHMSRLHGSAEAQDAFLKSYMVTNLYVLHNMP